MNAAVPEGWTSFVDALRDAGERLAADTAHLDEVERADGYRALLRGLHNALGRFEVDRVRPELVPFNGWRQKFFMDNPDFRYWVADVRGDAPLRITGNRGDAAYVSITAYAGQGQIGATAASRIDSDAMTFDEAGGFCVQTGGERPAMGDWIELPEGATAVWVRHFLLDRTVDDPGWCRIDPLGSTPTPPSIDPGRFAAQLRRLAGTVSAMPPVWAAATAADLERPNELRAWSDMKGGAAYTEPNIHYLRGGWQLGPDEALVIEGEAPDCRYWNILLYSRYLNSLDDRHRTISLTGATARVVDGRYRFVLAARDPGPSSGDWLDTEGRPVGIAVMRFLQPTEEPALPTTTVVALADLGGER